MKESLTPAQEEDAQKLAQTLVKATYDDLLRMARALVASDTASLFGDTGDLPGWGLSWNASSSGDQPGVVAGPMADLSATCNVESLVGILAAKVKHFGNRPAGRFGVTIRGTE